MCEAFPKRLVILCHLMLFKMEILKDQVGEVHGLGLSNDSFFSGQQKATGGSACRSFL